MARYEPSAEGHGRIRRAEGHHDDPLAEQGRGRSRSAPALLAGALGGYRGFQVHTAESALEEHACDDPVGPLLVSFGEEFEPGPLVVQDGGLSPDGVSMTYDVTYEPQTMALVERQGRRADSP